MIDHLLKQRKNQWIHSNDCAIGNVIGYIRECKQLRDAQIEAIETYLFLKIKGENKPLWQLFSEGFFIEPMDLNRLNINQAVRDYLQTHTQALALFQFARQIINGKKLLPQLENAIIENPSRLDYLSIIKDLFYKVNYPDYLMSLPMGAGKTYLMAAFIYLDLYFAQQEPENKAFAHNFLVLIPNGLKSSIVPSLKAIANFDSSWVLPEPAAGQLKKLLKFDVLDVAKSAKKSNKARNPNAQKVNACLPNPFGQVFVVNAEKVILESFDANQTLNGVEALDTSNELKRLFGQIPNLSLLIDEVHHAATDDIQLRQAVNYWHEKGNITTVLGFSGTPYLQKAETIKAGPADEYSFKSLQITNTVYYYPLTTAIEKFLKKPLVKVAHHLERLQIIKQGIEDFNARYANFRYADGSTAKVAIYCSSIEVLEEQVYPFLLCEMQLNADEVLKFHGGNAHHKLPQENEFAFRTLDLPHSPIKYILLVQVGKEGWDCRSLTGVILSQKGDSPANMVLQTACRCLRQMDKGVNETALIWLNQDNAETLNKQLKLEQNTSIEELNKLKDHTHLNLINRIPRIAQLNLPSITFKQLRVIYQSLDEAQTANTAEKLAFIANNIDSHKNNGWIGSSTMHQLDESNMGLLNAIGDETANFQHWLFAISKHSLNSISLAQLQAHSAVLQTIYKNITYEQNDSIPLCGRTEVGATRNWNDLYNKTEIENQIRLSFSIKRRLNTSTETVEKEAQLLLVEKLKPVENNPKLYPEPADIDTILAADKNGEPISIDVKAEKTKYEAAKAMLEAQGMAHMMQPFHVQEPSLAVKNKNRSFHYLPYSFIQSGFELTMLRNILREPGLATKDLEIYFNGERGLTEFIIDCYQQNGTHWQKIGKYTPDFLVIKRNAKNKIDKALIIETKGTGFAKDFAQKRTFMQGAFLAANPEFEFLYLQEDVGEDKNLQLFHSKVSAFFGESAWPY